MASHLRVVSSAPSGSPVPPSSTPPEWLSQDAKAEYRRIVKAVRHSDDLQAIDRAALIGYCEAWAMFKAATADVTARGHLVPGRSSADDARGDAGMVKNPSVQIMRDAQTQMRAWAKELGFTPQSRGETKGQSMSTKAPAERLLTS